MTNIFRGVQHVYCAKFMLTVSRRGNPIINRNILYKENFNNVLNQNVLMTKRADFAIFAISIVDNLSLLQHRLQNSPYFCVFK